MIVKPCDGRKLDGLGFNAVQNRIANAMSTAVKGQIISECLFDVFKFSKKPTKNLTNFCPGSKSGQIIK